MKKRSSTAVLQIVFFVALLVSVGQVTWWIFDSVRYSGQVRDAVSALYESEARIANSVATDSLTASRLAELSPYLSSSGARVLVDPSVVDSLTSARNSRVNRLAWEGAFFLIVLISAMAVISKAIKQDATFRSRQRNFIAAVTHELKSPIASLQLATETLTLREPSPADFERLTGRMMSDIKRLNGLVTNVLDAARVDEGAARTIGPVLLAEELVGAAEELRARADAFGVELKLQNETGATIQADTLGVRTILRNVLDNALKATAHTDGGSITLTSRDLLGVTEVTVSDNGVGFRAEESTKIFDRFYRPGEELRRETQGTGLGLFIVKRLIELDGGSVIARSNGPGKGAAFVLSWPREDLA